MNRDNKHKPDHDAIYGCEAKTETSNAFAAARTHDEKIDEFLDEVKARLKDFSCELFNLGEWLEETFERFTVIARAVDSETFFPNQRRQQEKRKRCTRSQRSASVSNRFANK